MQLTQGYKLKNCTVKMLTQALEFQKYALYHLLIDNLLLFINFYTCSYLPNQILKGKS